MKVQKSVEAVTLCLLIEREWVEAAKMRGGNKKTEAEDLV
jgi:hypothetical protein